MCIRGKEHDELGHIFDRGIGEQRPHEEVGLGEAWVRNLLIDESVVKFKDYSETIWLEE